MDQGESVHYRATMKEFFSTQTQKTREGAQIDQERPREGQADLTQCPFSVNHYILVFITSVCQNPLNLTIPVSPVKCQPARQTPNNHLDRKNNSEAKEETFASSL